MKSNNTHLNILISYAYIGKTKKFQDPVFSLSQQGRINLMFDSGAHSIHNDKNGQFKWLTIDNYCKFLDSFSHHCEKYVTLDVINNEKKSKENYELMINRGYNPMFVFTSFDEDYEYLKHAVNNNQHLCVAGGLFGNTKWIHKRYQDVYKKTGALIHGLGFVKFPEMLQLPLCSVDSSSWLQTGLVFGNVAYFDNGKIKNIHYKDILTRKKPVPPPLIRLLDKYKITPKQFSNLENHKKKISIPAMFAHIAYMEYQKYCKDRNLNLFLACSQVSNVLNFIVIDDLINEQKMNYENFIKYCKYGGDV